MSPRVLNSTAALPAMLAAFLFGHAALAAELGLPNLDSKRRMVLAEMRQAGLVLLDGTGDSLEFAGGPIAFRDAQTSTFWFDGLSMSEAELDFGFPVTNDEGYRQFSRLHRILVDKIGVPGFDMLHHRGARRARPLVSTWNDGDRKLTLRLERDGQLVVRLQRSETARKAGTGSKEKKAELALHEIWSPEHFENARTRAKQVAEELLFELGNQQFLAWGARQKGAPLKIRLTRVNVPTELEGVDRTLLESRFLSFVRGHWDVAFTEASRSADVDVRMSVVPANVKGKRRYFMHLEARATQGKARGRVLFAKATQLD